VGAERPGVTTLFELLPQAVNLVGHQAIAAELASLCAVGA
jgi:hypothetical protein